MREIKFNRFEKSKRVLLLVIASIIFSIGFATKPKQYKKHIVKSANVANCIYKKNKDNFIKHLKPRKNSKYHQGMYDPNQLSKYYNSCKNEPVIYRSGLEQKFIRFCENSTSIAKWASEPIKIPYFNRLNKKQQNYYPDYIIENLVGFKLESSSLYASLERMFTGL